MLQRPARALRSTSLDELATAFAIVFWSAVILGVFLDLHGTTWLLAAAAVLTVLLAAKALTNLILKRRR